MFYGRCFKITTSTFKAGHFRLLKLIFNKTMENADLITIKAYLTSEENAHGIITSNWMNGKALKIDLKQDWIKIFRLRPEKKIFLKPCNEESFYEFASLKLTEEYHKLGCQCSPYSFPFSTSDNITFCNSTVMKYGISTVMEQKCKLNWQNAIFKIINEAICPKPCSITQYSGELSLEGRYEDMIGSSSNMTYIYSIKYTYPSRNTTEISEEYLLYDDNTMVSTFGGTLGLFIGFSFSNVLTFMLHYLQILMTLVLKRA